MMECVVQVEVIVDLVMYGLDVYVVGGVICDVLFGLLVQDCDYVVVGVMFEDMEVCGF